MYPPNCILAPRSCQALPPVGRLWPSDADDDGGDGDDDVGLPGDHDDGGDNGDHDDDGGDGGDDVVLPAAE